MTDVTVVTGADTAAPSTPDTTQEAAAVAEGTEQTEIAADATVEIARIEAERDVTIAAIAAQTETAHADNMDARIDECQAQIRTLTETTETRLSSIQQRLIELGEMIAPPPSLPSEKEDGPKENPEATEVAVVETPPPPPAEPQRTKKRGHRWI